MPFVVQIHLQLAGEEHLPNFLRMCEEEDEAVAEAEPGMLYHSLDSHPDSSLKFTWTMILQDDQALRDHMANPRAASYMMTVSSMLQGGLDQGFRPEIWGSVDPDTVLLLNSTAPVPLKFYPKKLGFTPELYMDESCSQCSDSHSDSEPADQTVVGVDLNCDLANVQEQYSKVQHE